MTSFRKAFFPTEEERLKQKELLNELYEKRISDYINQGFSREEAEEQIDNEINEYMNRGYYS